MLNIKKLHTIDKNETSLVLLKFFQKCREISNETNLQSFSKFLARSSFHISTAEYEKFFTSLQELGVGYFDANNPNTFVWRYSFNNVADQILHPNKKIDIKQWDDDLNDMFTLASEELANKPQTPAAKDIKPQAPTQLQKQISDQAPQTITRGKKGRPKGAKNKDKSPRDVHFTFQTSKGEVSFDLADTMNLIRQVEILKQTLKAS